jgi:uncharacterized DUF497 family protein
MPEIARLTYHFDWDPVKARRNLADHKVSFQLASTLFRDSFAITIFDEGHAEDEDRWVTLGQAGNGQTLVVIHTFQQTAPSDAAIRIISARAATTREVRGYQETPR